MKAAGRLARRVRELAGWHLELYVDGAELAHLSPWLRSLPALVIDHLGVSGAGLPHLLALVSQGVLVKASGIARLDFDPGPTAR